MLNKALLAALAAVALLPLWFLLSGSLAGAGRIMAMPPPLFPSSPSLDNFAWALAREGAARWALNTLLVASSTALLSTAVSLMAGAAFAFKAFPGKAALWSALLSALMVPRIALVIPLFAVSAKLRLNGTLAVAVLPLVFSPAGMFAARAFMETIPRSLVEAARMDGATEAQVLFHVVAPVSRPLVALLALLSGVAALQDWVWQALQLQDASRQTLLVGWLRAISVRSTGDNNANPVGHAMAVGVLLLVPLLLLFVIANRHFIGALDGAEKG